MPNGRHDTDDMTMRQLRLDAEIDRLPPYLRDWLKEQVQTLRARIAELEAERDTWQSTAKTHLETIERTGDDWEHATERAEAAEAEVARLRGGLRSIANMPWQSTADPNASPYTKGQCDGRSYAASEAWRILHALDASRPADGEG